MIRRVLLAPALALAWVVPAAASPSWTAPVALAGLPGSAATTPSIALNGNGQAIEAWSEPSGSGDDVIRAATRNAASGWVTLPDEVSGGLPGTACEPIAAIDAAGDELVVWSQATGATCRTGDTQVRFATRAAGAISWSSPGTIGASAPAGREASFGASNDAGQIVVAWSSSDGTTETLRASVVGMSSSSTPAALAQFTVSSEAYEFPTAAIGPGGDAALAWNHALVGSSNMTVEVSARPRDGAFPGAPTHLTTLPASSQISPGGLAIDANGDVLATYTSMAGADIAFASRLRDPSTGAWLAPERIVTQVVPFTLGTVVAGFDAAGVATAVWHEAEPSAGNPRPEVLDAATRPAGSSSGWVGQAPITTGVVSFAGEPVLAEAPTGAAVVAWVLHGQTDGVSALYRPAGGSFGALQPIGSGFSPGVAIAPTGEAAVMLLGGAAFPNPSVSTLDAIAPVSTAAVPASAASGQVVTMRATAADPWSGLVANQPTWAFGDGNAATGTTVTHAYAVPGTYTVAISATDLAGNTATLTRQIHITGPPDDSHLAPKPSRRPRLLQLSLSARWKAGRLIGHVVVRGSTPSNAPLTLWFRPYAKKRFRRHQRVVPKNGLWKATIVLPAGLAPGRYKIAVMQRGLPTVQAVVVLHARR